jgi:hypothetical protein
VHRDLKPKTPVKIPSLGEFEAEYFGNWLYQLVHGLTQISKMQKSLVIARTINLPENEIKFILSRLELMGLVNYEKGLWKSQQNSMHLAKESPFIRNLHSTWKTKILSDLQLRARLEGTHFSGILAISEEDYQKIRELLVKSLNNIRKIAEASESENIFLLSIDCYKMDEERSGSQLP